jgi:hypothetical protein
MGYLKNRSVFIYLNQVMIKEKNFNKFESLCELLSDTTYGVIVGSIKTKSIYRGQYWILESKTITPLFVADKTDTRDDIVEKVRKMGVHFDDIE